MLNSLLETKPVTQRKPLGTIVSVVLHVAVIAAAVQVTNRSAQALTPPEAVTVIVPLTPKPDEKTPVARQRDAVAAPRSPFGPTTLVPPVDVPVDIPAVDVSARPTDPGDFNLVGAPGGSPDGVKGGAPVVDEGHEYFAFDVEKVASAIPGTASPSYPEQLKSAGVEGQAMVQFTVDTLGRAELASFKVLRASHDAFGTAVRAALPRMRFLPAETGGRKVRMVVQQTFAFALQR